MTKYFLQSGGIRNHPSKKKAFHADLVKDLGDNPRVLVCLFAQPREYWEKRYPSICDSFSEDLPEDIQASFKLAMPKTFEADCKSSDLIYMLGGDDKLCQFWLSQYDLTKIWEDKVVSGNSGSSQALSAHYWTCDWREPDNGLAVLPIKFMAHYESETYGIDDPRGHIDWDAAYNTLKEFGDTSLPVYALKEGDYVVIEQ